MKIEKYYLCGFIDNRRRHIMGRDENHMMYKKLRNGEWQSTNLPWRIFHKKVVLIELVESEVKMMGMNI